MTTAREETMRLADLLHREHHALGDFLVALAAFDRDRRWSDLGHASLFSFLRRELQLSAGAAQYRKTAAELVQKYPEVEAPLRDGRLCLSSVIEVAKVITPDNAAELLPRFFGLSSRDAAFVAASIRPVENPPQRFVVTPVRSGASADAPATAPDAPAGALQLRAPELPVAEGADAAPSISLPFQRSAAVLDRPTVKPLDAARARVSITVSRRFLDKLAAARDALSHSHPGASENEILEVGLDLILERQAKRRGLVKSPRTRAATPTSTPAPRSRYVPADVRRAVWERDRGCCQFRLESGGICGSTSRIEFHHRDDPFARGGKSTVENLEIRCRPHNIAEARAVFGNELMDRYTRPPKRGGCSEPVANYPAATSGRPLQRPRALPSARPTFRRSSAGSPLQT